MPSQGIGPGLIWGLAMLIRRYYRNVTARLKSLDESLGTLTDPKFQIRLVE